MFNKGDSIQTLSLTCQSEKHRWGSWLPLTIPFHLGKLSGFYDPWSFHRFPLGTQHKMVCHLPKSTEEWICRMVRIVRWDYRRQEDTDEVGATHPLAAHKWKRQQTTSHTRGHSNPYLLVTSKPLVKCNQESRQQCHSGPYQSKHTYRYIYNNYIT